MHRRRGQVVWVCGLCGLSLLCVACDDTSNCPTPSRDAPMFAALHTDYEGSASLSLLDARGRVTHPDWLSSASRPAGLSAALSGDLVFPSTQPRAGWLSWIDRFGADLVSEAPLPGSEGSARQFDTRGAAGGAAFQANPQDVLTVGDRLWVTRAEKNLDLEAPALAQGDDILVLQRATGDAVGRISLELARQEARLARPQSLVALGDGTALVGLWHLSANFREAGAGSVVLVDLATQDVLDVLRLAPLQNCGEVRRVRDGQAQVLCRGAPFTTDEQRMASAGIACITQRDGGLKRSCLWQPRTAQEAPSHGLTQLSEEAWAFVSASEGGDTLWRWQAGATTALYTSNAGFSLGRPASLDGRVLVADANRGVVSLDSPPSAQRSTCTSLALREITLLRGAAP